MKNKKALWRKLKSKVGFTLTELLLTTLILLMVSSVVAVGVPTAANAYFKVIDAANAQILLSTTVTKLKNELSLANFVSGGGNSIVYNTNGIKKTISKNNNEGIMVQVEDGDAQQLVPKAITNSLRSNNMVSEYTSINSKSTPHDQYKDIEFIITGLKITKDNRTIAGPVNLTIRTVTVIQ